MKVADINTDHLRLSGGAKKAGPLLAGIGALLLGISAALSSGEWTTFWKSYLFGWMVAVGIALGAMFFILLQHMTRAGWSISVRRLAEGIAKNLKWMWILFVPILVLVLNGNGDLLYQWGNVEFMPSNKAPIPASNGQRRVNAARPLAPKKGDVSLTNILVCTRDFLSSCLGSDGLVIFPLVNSAG